MPTSSNVRHSFFIGFENRLSQLQAQHDELAQRASALDAELHAATRAANLAERASVGASVDELNTQTWPDYLNETINLCKHVALGEYVEVLTSSVGAFLLGAPAPDERLDSARLIGQRVDAWIEQRGKLRGEIEVTQVGAALLQLFVQANWTGPPPAALADVYPLAIHASYVGQSNESHRVKLEAKSKLIAAATATEVKSITELDGHPQLHEDCASFLEVDGESVYSAARYLALLSLAAQVFAALRTTMFSETSAWWAARCATIHQATINSSTSGLLSSRIEAAFSEAAERTASWSRQERALLELEWAVARRSADESKSGERLSKAVELLGLKVSMSGALGKRTKFQIEDKSQLVLLATSDSTKAIAADSSSRSAAPNIATVKLDDLDKMNPLHERIVFSEDAKNSSGGSAEATARWGHLSVLDQVAVLSLCAEVQKEQAWLEYISAEESLAYVTRATEHPDNWSVYASALLIKSKAEFEKYKTKERAVLQMQVLIDQQSNRLTPTQFRVRDVEEDAAPAIERLRWIHALGWPPIWNLKRDLAEKYKHMHVVADALLLFLDIEAWEQAVACLIMMDKRNRAETLVLSLLEENPTPGLYCILADLRDDDELYLKAWEASNHRFARAQRTLGVRAFNRGDLPGAIAHFDLALRVNASFSWVWFRLGSAQMRLGQYSQAKEAFARVVALSPDDGEAWGNLAACLQQINEPHQALAAAGKATQHAELNWKIWDSYLSLALECEDYDGAMTALEHAVEIAARRADSGGVALLYPRSIYLVSLRALEHDRFRQRFERFVQDRLISTRLLDEFSGDIWGVIAEYYGALGHALPQHECMNRRVACLARAECWWCQPKKAHAVLTTLSSFLTLTGSDSWDSENRARRVVQAKMFARSILSFLAKPEAAPEAAELRARVVKQLEELA